MKKMFARAGITLAAVALFAVLRIDVVRAASQRFAQARTKLESSHTIETYLRTHTVRSLQIGAGDNNFAGWLNTDIDPRPGQAFLDATKIFPLPEDSMKYVYSEAVLEHVTYEQGMVMLKESFRVLEPGGTVRIVTPNLLQFIALFEQHRTPEMDAYIRMKMAWHKWPQTPDDECYILNLQLREWGHQFIYTPKMLRASLAAAGFERIREFRVSESDDPALRNLEARATWAIKDANSYENMVVEASKPTPSSFAARRGTTGNDSGATETTFLPPIRDSLH